MRIDRRQTIALLLAGLALLGVAYAVARTTIPEWKMGALPPRSIFGERFMEVAAELGIEVAPGSLATTLSEGVNPPAQDPWAMFGSEGDDWLLAEHRPVLVNVAASGTAPGGLPVFVSASFGLDGRPWEVRLIRSELRDMFTPQAGTPLPGGPRVLLRPGETASAVSAGTFEGMTARYVAIRGTSTPQFIVFSQPDTAPNKLVIRGPGDLETLERSASSSALLHKLSRMGMFTLLFVGVTVLAFVLAVRRRIDLTNATVLALLTGGASLTAAFAQPAAEPFQWLANSFATVFDALFLFLLWAAAESLLRDAGGETTNALDALRRGKIGRRVGTNLTLGLAMGAAAAGVWLLAFVLPGASWAEALALRPERSSILLPLFDPGRTPFGLGLRLAGETLLALAALRRVLPRRWAPWAAVLAVAALRNVTGEAFEPWLAHLVVELLRVGLLVYAFERAGSLAVATAGVTAILFPTLLFSAQHPYWLGGTLAVSALFVAAIAVVGLVGLRRSRQEDETVDAPTFLARLDEERRLRYEMDLLARMQLGLLPGELPRIPGWQVAARSLVANEVGGDFYDFLTDARGRLWIAAGDVAGHGSFCSIGHAMTKAALASLVRAERTPAEVLAETDRVLRTLNARRLFTALALLRLDPASGQALFANAGYPYPLLRTEGAVREIVLPGLPLGQGPARTYQDVALELPPGSDFVLCSDGLSEARTGSGEAYGFVRLERELASTGGDSAEALLDHLVARWRTKVGARSREDDTTLVIVRRDG